MNGFGQRYVVDTNALIQLRGHRRASSFFRECAAIPAEVLSEASGFPDIDTLRSCIYPTTPQVLEQLVIVMASIPVDDTALVNLYANLGGADPLVVACALDGRQLDSRYMDAPEWIVVTGDRAVRLKAEQFGLRVLNGEQFATLIDVTTNSLRPDEGADPAAPPLGCSSCGRTLSTEPLEGSDSFCIAMVCPDHGIVATFDPSDRSK